MTGYDRWVWNPASESADSPALVTGHDTLRWNPASEICSFTRYPHRSRQASVESDSHFVVDYLVARKALRPLDHDADGSDAALLSPSQSNRRIQRLGA
ncbi:unnamed protein product [Sphagnum jensenii]